MPTIHTDPAKHEGSTKPTDPAKHEGSTKPAKHGKSVAGTTVSGEFSFHSALTVQGVGIFTNGPFYISIPNQLNVINTPKQGIIISDGTDVVYVHGQKNDPYDSLNWNVTEANDAVAGTPCIIGNARNGLFLDCPASTGPGVGVIQTGFFLDNSSPTQQWDFELVKSIDDGNGFISNGYFIRNLFNNLVLTVPGVDQPGFSPSNGIALTLDLAFQPLKASQIWFAGPTQFDGPF